MPNNNKYIAFELNSEIVEEFYNIGQNISTQINNFSPFEIDQIHMTVCFLGELFKKIKTNKKEILENLLNEIKNYPQIKTLVFDCYELFGNKNNLIVAKFKMSKSEEKNIIELKKYYSSKFNVPLEDFYVPHITLGKILNMSEKNKINLNNIKISKPINNKLYPLSMKLV